MIVQIQQFNDIDFHTMNLAIEQAKLAMDLGEVPVGAVLIDENKNIISVGHNRSIIDNDPTAHAEILALRHAGKVKSNYRLPNTTLYVTLEPCAMCAGALIHARVSKVIYAAKDFRTGACGSVFNICQNQILNHSIEVLFLEDKNYIALLKKFFKDKRTCGNANKEITDF